MGRLSDAYQGRARYTDPVTSKAAAAAVTTSGLADLQAETVLAVLTQRPGLCSLEIPDFCDLDRYQCARRLKELESRGLIRRGAPRKSGGSRLSLTWWPI